MVYSEVEKMTVVGNSGSESTINKGTLEVIPLNEIVGVRLLSVVEVATNDDFTFGLVDYFAYLFGLFSSFDRRMSVFAYYIETLFFNLINVRIVQHLSVKLSFGVG